MIITVSRVKISISLFQLQSSNLLNLLMLLLLSRDRCLFSLSFQVFSELFLIRFFFLSLFKPLSSLFNLLFSLFGGFLYFLFFLTTLINFAIFNLFLQSLGFTACLINQKMQIESAKEEVWEERIRFSLPKILNCLLVVGAK